MDPFTLLGLGAAIVFVCKKLKNNHADKEEYENEYEQSPTKANRKESDKNNYPPPTTY